MNLLLLFLPAIFTLPVVLAGMRKKRFAIPLILILYVVALFVFAAVPHLIEMTETGQGDPQLVAGATSESIVSGILISFIILPILLLIWFFIRKSKIKKNRSVITGLVPVIHSVTHPLNPNL